MKGRYVVVWCLVLAGCSSNPPLSARRAALTAAIRSSTSLELYEGLPSEEIEPKLYKAELRKPTIEGLYYKSPIAVNPSDVATLKSLLPKLLAQKDWGAPACITHSDFRLVWRRAHQTVQAALCFSCEVMTFSEAGSAGEPEWVDFSSDALDLRKMFAKYRRNRPANKQWRHAFGER